MTDLSSHDKEIVKAAETVVDLWNRLINIPFGSPQSALEQAVAAKRRAMTPTPLSAEEAIALAW